MHYTKPLVLIPILLFSVAVFADQKCDESVEKKDARKIFIDNKDGTITDTKTGLMWQQCLYSKKRGEEARYIKQQGACSGRYYTFPTLTFLDAGQAASDSDLAGYTDWRLPTIEEWEALTARMCDSEVIKVFFPNRNTSSYWSSTEVPNSSFVESYNLYSKRKGRNPKEGGLGAQFVRDVEIEKK